MRISSLEIKQHEFEKSFRGYNAEEVNSFLSNIAQEWDRMLNELKMLKMQLDIAEKEASKLREVEMTLFKTLRNAEEQSIQMTDTAQKEASKRIEEATSQAQLIKADAEVTARQIVQDADARATEIRNTAQAELAEMDQMFANLENKKNTLLNQLKGVNAELNSLLDGNEVSIETVIKSTPLVPKVVEEEEEEIPAGMSFSSAVNEINLESSAEDVSDLEIIEGIGPKIKEILVQAGIATFRSLATTPEYKLRDILVAAGPHFAAHDPSTWNDQALLAESGKWDELEALKEKLVGGRHVEETPQNEPEEISAIDTSEEKQEAVTTEEMLDKVNKVKAAIRKAMVEKPEEQAPPKTVNEMLGEKRQQSSSFFDGIS